MKLVGTVWVFWVACDQDGSVLIVNDYNLFKQHFGQDYYLSLTLTVTALSMVWTLDFVQQFL
jgi:hypothetical protein